MENMGLNQNIFTEVDPNFWSRRRVLVTGHTGFKGSWLCLWLQSMGALVFGLSRDVPTSPSLFEQARVADGIESCFCDIRNLDATIEQFRDFQPDIVFHMAAQPLVRYSYHQPVETYETNVMGSIHVLEAARRCNSVSVIVNVTTDKCYRNEEWVWGYRETDVLGGSDPYSSSKACVELISQAYRKSFLNNNEIELATVRAGNVVGGGDWASDRLIPDILRSLQKNETVYLRNPSAVRPWQHVLDPLSGYIILAEKMFQTPNVYSDAWNFGPAENDAKSVEWIAKRLCSLWGEEKPWEFQHGDHPAESTYLTLDTSKVRKCLNWSPRWELSETLQYVVDWHKAWCEGVDARLICMEQISAHTGCSQST